LTLVSQGEKIESRVIKFNTLKNEERHYLVIFSPIMSGEDSIATFLIMQDITENLQQQAQLRSTTHGLEVFKAALSSAAAITVLDLNGDMVEVNDLFTEQTSYTAEELLGTQYRKLSSRIHSVEFEKNIIKTLSRGEIWRGEFCNQTKNGEYYWVDSTMIPLKNVQGTIEQYLIINFNITDKKRILTELQNIERTFRLITENTNDLIVITDEYGI
ncbi:MAG: PAS domain-containing protein, partial [Lysinibacillus sp.]